MNGEALFRGGTSFALILIMAGFAAEAMEGLGAADSGLEQFGIDADIPPLQSALIAMLTLLGAVAIARSSQ